MINTKESGTPNLVAFPPKNGTASIFKANNPTLAQISDPDRYYPLFTLRKAIGDISVYGQFDTSPRSSIRTPAAYATDNRLIDDGNNIVSLLKRIQNHYPLVYENEIKPLLIKVNPNFQEIGFEDFGAKSNLVLREHQLAKRVSIEHISDGTLRFILLLGILYNPERGSVVCLDEPETGLHPDMIHTVAVGIQRAAREGSQMVVATHSPILLNSFQLGDLIVFDKNEQNEIRISTPSEDEFEERLSSFLPGQMWLQGLIGGRRWA